MKRFITISLSLSLILSPVAQVSAEEAKAAKEEKLSGSYAQQILAISIAGVGTSILTVCQFSTLLMSMKAYGAGSVVYIGSEILGGKAQNENHKKKVADLKITEEKLKELQGGGEVQKAAIETRLKEEEQTLAFINKRKMWTMAATAMYATATGLAVYEMIRAMQAVPPAVPPLMVAGCTPVANPSIGLVKGALVAAFTFGASKTSGGGMIGQYGSMGAALAVTMTSLGSKVSVAYNTPKARIVTFGASAALTGLVMKDLMDKSKVVSDNISKLKKVSAQFNNQTQGDGGVAPGSTAGAGGGITGGVTSGAGAGGGVNPDVNLLSDASLPRHCWSNSSQGMDYSESACSNPVQFASPKFDASLNLPTLTMASNLGNDMANAYARGDMAGAEIAAGSLAGMAGRIDEVNDNLEKQLNERLKKSGDKPMDVKKDINDRVASLMNDVSGGSGGLAATGAGSNPSSNSDQGTNDASKMNTQINVASAPSEIAIPGSGGVNVSEGEFVDPSLAQLPAKVDPKAQYDFEEKDVSERKDVSLFDQVSNRYLFNYSKIFDKKELKAEKP